MAKNIHQYGAPLEEVEVILGASMVVQTKDTTINRIDVVLLGSSRTKGKKREICSPFETMRRHDG